MKLIFSKATITIILISTLIFASCQSETSYERQIPSPNVTHAQLSHVWAVRIDKPGLPNLHRVSDELYRGAQPTADGFSQLKSMGVKTVINLRFFYNQRDKLTGTDLGYEEIPMNAWHAEDEDVMAFLNLVADKSRAPYFMHCQYGADRTGMMCAVYRIIIQGWTKDEAIAEMTQGGFGFHEIYQNIVKYILNLDVENQKKQASRSS